LPGGFGHGDPGWRIDGIAGRYDPRGASDDFTQAGNLFRLLPSQEKQNLFKNIAGSLSQVGQDIRLRQLGQFDQADPLYGAGVRGALAELGF